MSWQCIVSKPVIANSYPLLMSGATAHLLARKRGRPWQRRRPRHPGRQRWLRQLLTAVGIAQAACLSSPCQHPPVIALPCIDPAGSSALLSAMPHVCIRISGLFRDPRVCSAALTHPAQ